MRKHPTQVLDDDQAHDVPPAATGGLLHGDPMTQLARRQDEQARTHLLPQHTEANPYGPPVVESHRADGWAPTTRAFSPGEAVELLGRDDCRLRVDITNQSSAITGSTTPPTVFLFASEQQAQTFADDTSAQQLARLEGRGLPLVVLPDGAGRTLKHTAPVWAVAYDNGGTDLAVVDVSVERRSGRR